MADYTDTQLGRETSYSERYDPSLLYPIPRAKARRIDSEDAELPFTGVDLWTAYEISWLNPDGLPQIAIGEFMVPCTSEFIVESKSLKLYLNSYIQTEFVSALEVEQQLASDLSAAAGAEVEVILYQIAEYNGFKPISEPDGHCIDNYPVSIDVYQPSPALLRANSDIVVEETLYSHLLKTNCPVTNQPDWASVYISYQGPKIDRRELLKYIVSYREHQDFHEQCVESLFTHIMAACNPEKLSVYARSPRRGGLDINPFRSTWLDKPLQYRHVRQ